MRKQNKNITIKKENKVEKRSHLVKLLSTGLSLHEAVVEYNKYLKQKGGV